MKTVVCPDGTEVRAETDDELIAGVEAWLARSASRLAGGLSREEILRRAIEDGRPETGGASSSPARESRRRLEGGSFQ